MEKHSGSTRQGHRGEEGTKMREYPRGLQGPVRRSRAAKGGWYTVTGHDAKAGKRCGGQRQEAESGRWWTWVTYRWTALCDGRGGG